MTAIAYFISSHGFGHAARSSAVMSALHRRMPNLTFEIFTQSPRWFFEDTLSAPFSYHDIRTDVGLVQTDPLHEDMDATIRALNCFLPFEPAATAPLAAHLSSLDCRLVICDISPLGLYTAQQACIPSVLIENFTWDWIYENYQTAPQELKVHATHLKKVFSLAGHHIQARPVTRVQPCDLVTDPVSRTPRCSRKKIRQRLEIPDHHTMVLISMGGVPMAYRFLHRLRQKADTCFVVSGASEMRERQDNVICLGAHSAFYHPDLLNAADVLVGKAGYSTLAEAYHCRVPFIHVSRGSFPETHSLTDFISRQMSGHPITESEFESAAWLGVLDRLTSLPRRSEKSPNGADQIADFLINILSHS